MGDSVVRANNVGACACHIDSNEFGKTMREHNANTCNVREMVETRLYRVRHLWNDGPGVINHGRDTIESLPFHERLDIFDALFSVINFLFSV